MALRSRRVSDLESRVERGATELAELRSRMHQLREDFQYNLNLLDERDRELERYDAQFARAATEAEDAARQVREARLAARGGLRGRRWRQRVRVEAHHARRVAEMRDAVERERFNRDGVLRQREEFDAHSALMRQIAERDELLETAQSDARDAVAAEASEPGRAWTSRSTTPTPRRRAQSREGGARAPRGGGAPPRRRGAGGGSRARGEGGGRTRRLGGEARGRGGAARGRRRAGHAAREAGDVRAPRRAPVRGRRRGGGGGGGRCGWPRRRPRTRARRPRRPGSGATPSTPRRARRSPLAATRSRRARTRRSAPWRRRAPPRAPRAASSRRVSPSHPPRIASATSRASDALVNAERALAEKEDAVAAKRHAERALAAAGARETSLAEQMARLRFGDAKDAALAAANERARRGARRGERRAPSPSTSRGKPPMRRARKATSARRARRALREPGGEAGGRRGGGARGGGVARRGAGRARAAARLDERAAARRAPTRSPRSPRRTGAARRGERPWERPWERLWEWPWEWPSSFGGVGVRTRPRDERVRLRRVRRVGAGDGKRASAFDVAAMRAEMETMQRAAFEHAGSTPGSTPRLLAQTLGRVHAAVPERLRRASPPPSPAARRGVELELARGEASDPRRRSSWRWPTASRRAGPRAPPFGGASGFRADRERAAGSTNDLALAGSPPAFTARRVRGLRARRKRQGERPRGRRARSALKKTARQTEVRRVRNWNVTADETEPRDTVVVHQR